MRKLSIFLIIFILAGSIVFAQQRRRYKYKSVEWKKDRNKVFFNLGATNFLGDLGGANKIGSGPFSLRDFDYQAIRPSIQLGYKYQFARHFSSRSFFNYSWLSGNDANTKEIFRQNRNLNFRTPIYELASAIEYSYEFNQNGHRYNLGGVRGFGGWSAFSYTPYAYVGVGGYYFNAKGKYAGKWNALRTLTTEGEGLVSTRKQYSPLQFTIPLGIGLRVRISKAWEIGIEYTQNICFTDYIDDVSTTYFDKNALLNSKGGQLSVDMANPALNNSPGSRLYTSTLPGEQRGDPKRKDSFMSLTLNVYCSLGRRFFPKHRF